MVFKFRTELCYIIVFGRWALIGIERCSTMSSERLESIEDELKALLEQVQRSITYQLPSKVGGME